MITIAIIFWGNYHTNPSFSLHDAVDFHSLLHPRAQDTRHLLQKGMNGDGNVLSAQGSKSINQYIYIDYIIYIYNYAYIMYVQTDSQPDRQTDRLIRMDKIDRTDRKDILD